jgi:putative ABC transport system permease protein
MPSVQFLANELHELQTSATILPALCLGVVGLVLHIVTGRMVTQQRTTIGTLRALGYTRTFIVRHYLGYGLVVGLSSALAGLALGLWIQSAMIRLQAPWAWRSSSRWRARSRPPCGPAG